jgi:3-deoxy-7-phosphoheptulonate synthase
MQTDNLRITKTYPLITPAVLAEEYPLTETASSTVSASRKTTRAILGGEDKRLLVIVGPCSIHDPTAAVDYAQRLERISKQVEEKLFCIMRVYFEKPRTTVGWKGLINDPHLDESHRINEGLRLARKLLTDIAETGLPAATEFLDTTLGQYYTDLITWGAIGARTVESQVHRQLASGLSMPVGFKNRTDGNIQVAVDAIRAASSGHLFPSLTKEGTPAILETSGNPDGHLVLRGGDLPNYSPQDIRRAVDLLTEHAINPRLIVDCSHANSGKDHEQQPLVAKAVAADRKSGQTAIAGIMLESHLVAGRQDHGGKLVYGQSITDACIGIDDTARLLQDLAASL